MAGLTLEQLQKMGATPVQRVGTNTPPPSGGLTADQLKGMGASPGAPAPEASPKSSPFTLIGASGNEGPISAPLKTVANIPGSAVGFAKSTFDFFNPLNRLTTAQDIGQSIYDAGKVGVTVGDVVKGLPQAAYQTLVPKFFQSLFSGDTKGALKVLEEDPVGQLAPVILAGRGIAEKAGFGPQFDSVMSKTTDTATAPIRAVARGAGNLVTNTLGITTGAGGESVKTAIQGGSDFTDAMRGNTSMSDVLQESQDALTRLKNMRTQEYQSKLENVKTNTASLDISPVFDALDRNMKSFNVKPVGGEIVPESFSRSTLQNDPSAQAVFKTVYDNLKSYGTQPGDRTPIALDTLKRSLGDLYSENSSVRSFAQDMKDSVRTVLNDNVPGYQDMTKGYEQYSNLIKDIKQNLAVGGKAGEATAISRLSSALKQNQELRLEVLKDFEAKTGINLRDKIAGAALGETLPRGLIGKGIDLYAVTSIFRGLFDPSVLAQIMATSPRVVGEVMNALGVTSRGVWKVLKPINEAPMLFFSSGKPSPKANPVK